ncbi:HU family DNA-binding protein [Undibacterium sp. FT147W]|uniref:HU family DNA-binding protein n=1 Tax=Undibacterium rivi TaxID=2828729 RepID=A0ABS5H6T6_9BURK|nr:HU family DNA-binding protein [Undibacterium rivi]MBR7793804.1 HU family DNA-binding protein [Undibacterium rivi]
MNKAELVKHLAESADVTKAQAESILNELVATVKDTVAAGNEITITDLGKFSATERAARTGRNPKTGEDIEIPAKRAPKFSPAKSFKDLVNK